MSINRNAFIVGVLLLLAQPCQAAITYVGASTPRTTGSAVSIASNAYTPTAGNLLIAFWSLDNVGNTITPSADGSQDSNTWDCTSVAVVANDSGKQTQGLCFAENIAGTLTNDVVTVSFGSSNATPVIVLVEYAGVATSSSLDVSAVGEQAFDGTTATVTSAAFTTTTNDQVIVCGLASLLNPQAWSPTAIAGSAGTERVEGEGVAVMDRIVTATVSTATATGTVTTNFSRYSIVCGTFKQAGGGGGGGVPIGTLGLMGVGR